MEDLRISTLYNQSNVSVKLPLQVCLLFFYIYEFNLSNFGLPTAFTSRRIVIVVTLVILLVDSLLHGGVFCLTPNGRTKRVVKKLIILLFTMLCYSIIMLFYFGFNEGDVAYIEVIELLLFGVLPIFLFYRIFKDIDSFMKALLIVTIIQALIVVGCMLNSSFSIFIDTNFSTDLAYTQAHRGLYGGGLACITAPGFFRFSLGLISCVYFLLKTYKEYYLILYFALSFIGTMIARVGLVVAIVGLVIITICLLQERKAIRIIRINISVLLIIVVCMFLLRNDEITSFLSSTFIRLINLYNNGIEKEFFSGYFGNSSGNIYPGLSSKTFWGTGIVNGISGNGATAYVDGGYIRIFFAFGLPLCVVFYLFVFGNLCFLAIKSETRFYSFTLLFYLCVMIIGEFKEYTIFLQYMICLFFTASILIEKSGALKTI